VKLVVVIPAFNAARHLNDVVARVVKAAPAGLARILVVDDGSVDETALVARALAQRTPALRVITRAANGGYGAAMKTGLAAAIEEDGATHVAAVHADGQYSPEALSGLLEQLRLHDCDILQGSRIAGGGALAGGMPLYKFVGNWVFNQFERRVFALPLTDFHSGYLVYGPRALARIPFVRLSDSFDFDMEVIAAARARGLSVAEAPIPTHYGDEISYLNPMTYTARVLRVMWRFKRGDYAA
jgi:glycosyltransferase involved in cell wall biosynthesis